jgi:hypothetical protein
MFVIMHVIISDDRSLISERFNENNDNNNQIKNRKGTVWTHCSF